jgi:GMP synthase (glutamine-hydrolysing)
VSRTAVAIRHVAFEDLAAFAPPLAAAGYDVRYHDVGVDPLDGLDALSPDLLIVLGGPIGVYETAFYPFLIDEIRLLAGRIAERRPTLGICLGGQLMAAALGAPVRKGPAKEIGFAPVELTEAGRQSCLSAFEGAPILHWHGDAFELPEGATRLASTPLCPNQAFAIGRNILGLQCHPEIGSVGFERWLIGNAGELAGAGIDVRALRSDHLALGPELDRRATALLSAWLEQLDQ